MNMTLKNPRGKDGRAYQKGREDATRQFTKWLRDWLETFPNETASDLKELFRQAAKTDDEQLKAEIFQTIEEIILPESTLIDMQAEFELTHEDSFVRSKLTSYREKIGNEIKRRRNELDLSQIELAEKAGISQSHICRLETGIHVPTHATIERVAKALGTTPSQLDPGFNDEE